MSRHRADGPASTPTGLRWLVRDRRTADEPDATRRALIITPVAGLSVAALAVVSDRLLGRTDNYTIAVDAPTQALDIDPGSEWDGILKPKPSKFTPTADPTPTRPIHTVKPEPTVRKPRKTVAPQKAPASKAPATTRTLVRIRERILSTGKEYFGVPYKYGGEDPATGLDCSAYTQLVYGRNGLKLPRVSRDQHAYCEPVSKPLPGDLVFLGSPIHHVGIYVRPGVMMDAPNRGQEVGYSDIWGPPRYGRHPKLA